MKRAILLVVVLVGGAFYLGWFTFTTDSSGPTEHVNIAIDKDKVHADEARAIEKLHAYEQQIEAQSQNTSPEQARPDRAAFRPTTPAPQTVSPYGTAQPDGYGGQPAGYSTQPAGYPTQPVEAPAAGPDPYELPEEPRPVARPAARPAAETDSFSRGFE
jgi:hypothetical protein